MPNDQPDVAAMVILVIFGVMILIALIALITRCYNMAYPWLSQYINTDKIAQWRARMSFSRSQHKHQDDDEDDEDMTFDTVRLLSIVPSISVVVDDGDEVLRANPEAYRLGVVDDDIIINDDIADAVHKVREHGEKIHLELVAQTPQRFLHQPLTVDDHAGLDQGGYAEAVSRPNWIKVTVGKISGNLIVVLIDDVSEERRFAQVRDDFVANVTEQLLKPTKALEALGAELERDDVDVDRIVAEAGQVRFYSRHLDHLVSDLLLLIKAQGMVVPSEDNRVNLFAQVEAAVDSTKSLAQDRHVRVVVRGNQTLEVHAETEQLQGALVKLIENAIEYSPHNGAVGVSVAASKDGKQAMVRVVDQGKGIAKEEQHRIFERFYRGGNQSDQSKDGVGLGLSIAKHVALTHHGYVTVWSAPKKGSTFTLALPLAEKDES